MKTIDLNDLLKKKINVQIKYIDTDKSTILHENTFTGQVLQIDQDKGITIQPETEKSPIVVIPPTTAAGWYDENNIFNVSWLVYRLQEVRRDGEHEWWDWQPERHTPSI